MIRSIGRAGKAKLAAKQEAKRIYFQEHGQPEMNEERDDRKAPCQLCNRPLWMSEADPHHKRKASLGGGDHPENFLAVHRKCHNFLHANPPALKAVEQSQVSVITGGRAILPQDMAAKLLFQ